MNLKKMPNDFLLNMTDPFSIERNGEIISSARGFFCGKDYPNTIQLVEVTEVTNVCNGDWLIHSLTGQRYLAVDTTPIRIGGEISDWMIKYQSEFEYKNIQKNYSTANIHIGTVSGTAIIGNQQNATLTAGYNIEDIAKLISTKPSSELPALCELVAELKKIEDTDAPIKKGQLAKFSDTLEKHSDLLIALGGWAAKLLTGN